jgi:hypothetical protein
MKVTIFRDVTRCSLVDIYQRFGGPCCLYQYLNIEAARSWPPYFPCVYWLTFKKWRYFTTWNVSHGLWPSKWNKKVVRSVINLYHSLLRNIWWIPALVGVKTIMFRRETWSKNERDIVILNTKERKVLRKVYGSVTELRFWIFRTNRKLKESYNTRVEWPGSCRKWFMRDGSKR